MRAILICLTFATFLLEKSLIFMGRSRHNGPGRRMDWTELDRAVKAQRKLGHPIASHIHALNLPGKKCTLLLEGDEEDDDNEVYPVPRRSLQESGCF